MIDVLKQNEDTLTIPALLPKKHCHSPQNRYANLRAGRCRNCVCQIGRPNRTIRIIGFCERYSDFGSREDYQRTGINLLHVFLTRMKTFADRAIAYYNALEAPTNLPPGIDVMNPYKQPDVRQLVNSFYTRFFSDTAPRVFVLGINPGRFGAGVTGISFTTPQNLRRYCGIENSLRDTPELSSRFYLSGS